MADPGGFSSALTSEIIADIRNLDRLARFVELPVMEWPVLEMALQTVGDREGGSHWPLWRRMPYQSGDVV